jgi:hypothetical protein
LHPGVELWLRYKRGWPPMYASLENAPYEVVEIFEYLLRADDASEQGSEVLDALTEKMDEVARNLFG